MTALLEQPDAWAASETSSPCVTFRALPKDRTSTGNVVGVLTPVWSQQIICGDMQARLRLPMAAAFFFGSGSWLRSTGVIVETRNPGQLLSEALPLTATTPDAIARIRSSLSLQIKELAEVLKTTRPTVYAWINGTSLPQPQNLARIRQVARLAAEWDAICNYPIGRAIRENYSNGRSVLDLLREDHIPEQAVLDCFRSIALSIRQDLAARKPSLRELAKARGLDISVAASQDDEIDVLTGKRVSMD